MRLIITILALLFLCVRVFPFSKTGTVYATDGSRADVVAAIADASAGDTVGVPAGTFTWGASGTSIGVNKAITLAGAGAGNTIISLSSTGPSWSAGVIRLLATGAVVRDMTINGANSGHVAAFAAGAENGWRITGIDFNGGTDGAYFAYVGTYGLIDNCTIDSACLTSELIFGRGPSDSWQTASSLGTTNAVYIETCTFGTYGYVCDANSNARMVVRFCTISGPQKIDGHGKASNTPARGVRHMEVYNNYWTLTSSGLTALELRGGSGMVFDNLYAGNGASARFYLREYGCLGQWANFGNAYQTPVNYPIDDQIGVGVDPKTAGSEPMYLWNNKDGSSAAWPFNWYADLTGAIALYRTQTGNPSATFTMQDIITADRDYFNGVASFNGSTGVGQGTKAQMLAITSTKTGVGFWVTDEADWDSTHDGPDGQLYVWNGSQWNLKYTPLVYPHPLTGNDTIITNPPSISLSAPPNGDTYLSNAPISLLSVVSAGTGNVTNVVFFCDNANLLSVTSAPYSGTFYTNAGTYQITAAAYDDLGLSSTTSVSTITVTNSPSLPPSISLSADQSAYLSNAPITLTATVTEGTVTVTNVFFWCVSTQIGSDSISPYTATFSTNAGSYNLTATAWDNSGLSATSSVVSITVTNSPPPVPPRLFLWKRGN